MRRLRLILMAATLIAGCSAFASAQGGWYHDGDGQGWRRGDGDHDADDYYRGGRGLFFARKFGFEDGFNDGVYDRQSGHSFRPTHSRNYRHADRGFDGRFVSRYAYKDEYRENYVAGYRRGYWRGGWYRW